MENMVIILYRLPHNAHGIVFSDNTSVPGMIDFELCRVGTENLHFEERGIDHHLELKGVWYASSRSRRICRLQI